MVSEEFTRPQLHLATCAESLKPEDSFSNIGTKISGRTKLSLLILKDSRTSFASVAKAKAAVRSAVLQAEAANLESSQAIQREELSLQLERGRLWSFERRSLRPKLRNSCTLRLRKIRRQSSLEQN